jgi:hypothetical protein
MRANGMMATSSNENLKGIRTCITGLLNPKIDMTDCRKHGHASILSLLGVYPDQRKTQELGGKDGKEDRMSQGALGTTHGNPPQGFQKIFELCSCAQIDCSVSIPQSMR